MDLDDSLQKYPDDRRTLVNRLRCLSEAEWNRAAEHGEYSHYSVLIMFRQLTRHDFFHAYRIEAASEERVGGDLRSIVREDNK